MMKKVFVVALACLLIISLASVGMAAEPKQHAYQGEKDPVSEGFGPGEGCGNPVGQMIRDRVHENEDCQGECPEGECPKGECPLDVESEESEEEAGMPYQHRLSGREYGQMIREMAHQGPGEVARYMHQWRFCYPTIE